MFLPETPVLSLPVGPPTTQTQDERVGSRASKLALCLAPVREVLWMLRGVAISIILRWAHAAESSLTRICPLRAQHQKHGGRLPTASV